MRSIRVGVTVFYLEFLYSFIWLRHQILVFLNYFIIDLIYGLFQLKLGGNFWHNFGFFCYIVAIGCIGNDFKSIY